MAKPVDLLTQSLDRMEPGIGPVPPHDAWVSMAISARRQADALIRIATVLEDPPVKILTEEQLDKKEHLEALEALRKIYKRMPAAAVGDKSRIYVVIKNLEEIWNLP